MTLYRAWAYADTGDRQHPHPTHDDMLVYFEAAPHQRPVEHLQQLVGAAWGVPASSVQCWNLSTEAELRRGWGDDHVRGDAVLLQTGSGPDGPLFAQPDSLQLLCGPAWHQRLVAAQRECAALAAQAARRAAARAVPAASRTPVGLDDLADRRVWRNAAMGL